MNWLNYDSRFVEKFAIGVIAKSFNSSYADYIWHNKDDAPDFTSPSDENGLEAAVIISSNEESAIEYEVALGQGKKPDVNRVEDATTDDNGNLLIYYGGSMDEIRDAVMKMIEKKENKRRKRKKKYERNELCLCIFEGGLFNTTHDFDFIVNSYILGSTEFSRLFLITSSSFYIIENNIIKEYERKY